MNNWLGLLISFIYIFTLIGGAEALRKWRGFSSDFTRKMIHIGVGMMMWGLHYLFDNPWFFIGTSGVFMVINFLDWRFGYFAAMSSQDRANLGTVYFPFAAAVVAYLFWEQPPLMVAALMPLTWGDGLAPVIGRKYGRHPYFIHNHKRTIEGSLGFLVAAFLAVWLALWLIAGQPQITPINALLPAFVIAFATMLVEGISIWGLDNLTITAVSILLLNLFSL